MMVALPRAVPIPRPFMALGPTRLNLEGLRGVFKTGREGKQETVSQAGEEGEEEAGGGDVHGCVGEHVGNDEEPCFCVKITQPITQTSALPTYKTAAKENEKEGAGRGRNVRHMLPRM